MATKEPSLADAEAAMKAAQVKFATLNAPLLEQGLKSISDEKYLAGVKAARDALPEGHPARNALHNVVTSIEVHQTSIRHHIATNEALLT